MFPVSIFLLFLITIAAETNAECCWNKFLYSHGHSIFLICADGTRVGSSAYCGVGRCNFLGCDCDGGCRHNSEGDTRSGAVRMYKKIYSRQQKSAKLSIVCIIIFFVSAQNKTQRRIMERRIFSNFLYLVIDSLHSKTFSMRNSVRSFPQVIM